MSAKFLWENLYRQTKRKDIFTLLKDVPVFENLSRRELNSIEHILHRRVYAKNEHIFRFGDKGLGMYLIESGEVSIVTENNREIVRLTDGEFFGELALFSDRPRDADAIAARETRVFGFFQPDLLGLLETHPKVGLSIVMKLAGIITERLRRATEENNRLNDTLAAGTIQGE